LILVKITHQQLFVNVSFHNIYCMAFTFDTVNLSNLIIKVIVFYLISLSYWIYLFIIYVSLSPAHGKVYLIQHYVIRFVS